MKAPNWLTDRLMLWAYNIMNDRKPDFAIGPRENRYMLRWWAIPRTPMLNIYIHKFLRDDNDEALHDHPWPSISITLNGRMREVYAPRGSDAKDPGQHATREIVPNDVTWRGLWFAHRIELLSNHPAVTVFITGPKLRPNWGFHCPKGWRPWHVFVEHNKETGERGRGCA